MCANETISLKAQSGQFHPSNSCYSRDSRALVDPHSVGDIVKLEIQIDRLSRELDRMAEFSDAPAPAVTRVLFTPPDMAARAYFAALCREAGLAFRQDAIGNLFARWEGSQPGQPAVATGSHTDAIPFSGKYDGTVGVL